MVDETARHPAPPLPVLTEEQAARLIAEYKAREWQDEVRKRDEEARKKGEPGFCRDGDVGLWILEEPADVIPTIYSPLTRGERVTVPAELRHLPAGLFAEFAWGAHREGPPWRRATPEEEATNPPTLQTLLKIFRASRPFASARAVSAEIYEALTAAQKEFEVLQLRIADLRESARLAALVEKEELTKSGHSIAEVEEIEALVSFRVPASPLTESQKKFRA